MQFKHTTLGNGMTVLAEILPGAISTAVGLFVKTGSRDERTNESGISHFLEHMVFKGSLTRSAWDVNRELDELGGQGNAYTGEEHTAYHTTVLPRYQDRAVRLLCDFLRPALREEDFEAERSVILEEIAKYQDQPPFGAAERLSELYFTNHPLAGSILGTAQSVGALTPDDLRDYLGRRYVPNNCVIVAAGMVDFEQLVKQIEAETLEMAPAPIAPRQAPTLHSERRTDTIKVPDVASAYVLRCGPAPSTTDPRRYAARMAASILGDDGGSRFFWELIDTGKAETAVAWVQEYDDCGLLNTFLACDPHDVKACLKTMDRVAKKVARTLTEAELREAQSRANSAAILGSERPSNRMFSLGEDWMSLGRYESLDEVLESYRRVSLAEVKSVIEQFGFEPHAEVQVMPQ